MEHRYCSTCGSSLAPDAHFCGRCGTPSTAPPAAGWSGAEETYVPGRTDVPGYPTRPGDSHPTPYSGQAAATVPPGARPPGRRPSAPVLLAGGAVVLALVAAGVALLVHPGGGTARHSGAAVTSASAGSAGSAGPSRTDGLVGQTPASGPPTASILPSTLAPAGAPDAVPRTGTALRAAYESGTPVDTGPYAEGSALAFTSPSHNIECVATTEGTVALTCAIGVYDFSQPGPDCNNGAVLTIDGYGRAGYTGCLPRAFSPGSSTLAYGGSVSAGEFGCVSRSVGVTCLDLATNTGFTLSKQEFVPVN